MPESNTPNSNNPLDPRRPAGIQVDIANQQDRPCDLEQIVRAISTIVEQAEFVDAEISVAIVDDTTIHELNRAYLNHDYETDVLSFVLALDEDERRLEGEIIVSADTAERVAQEVGWSLQNELLLYLIHGALHLVGYDDKTPSDRHEMRAAERRYLTLMEIPIPASMQTSIHEGGSP